LLLGLAAGNLESKLDSPFALPYGYANESIYDANRSWPEGYGRTNGNRVGETILNSSFTVLVSTAYLYTGDEARERGDGGSEGFVRRTSQAGARWAAETQQFDENLGMYFLRARYLNTQTERFHNMDTFEGRNGEPLTLHKYLYAHSNPVMGIDPSGNFTLVQALATTVVVGTLTAIAVPSIKAIQAGEDFFGVVDAALKGFTGHINCLVRGGYDKESFGAFGTLSSVGGADLYPYFLYNLNVPKNLVAKFFPKAVLSIGEGKAATTSLLRVASTASQKFWGSNDLIAKGLRQVANGLKGRRGLSSAHWRGVAARGSARLGLAGLLGLAVARTGTCLGEQIGNEL